jgi:gamma-glutamyltranspeptidase/glutathione hydrolase
MQEYEVIWTTPYHGKYKDYDIFLQGAPDMGSPRLIEALNIAEEIGLSEKEHYSKSASTLATIYQILSATLYSSNLPSYYGDSIDLSPESRINKEISKTVWEIWNDKNNLKSPEIYKIKNEHTAAIVAVDKYGNVATLIHSIIATNWGSTGLFIDGVSIPDPACFQQEMIEKVGKGNRLPTRAVPGLVFRDEKPILGFGCISGGAENQTFVSLINVLDFNMTPQESVENPGIGSLSFVNNNLSLSIEPNTISDSIIIQLTKQGAHTHESFGTMSKFWTGVYIAPDTKEMEGTEVWLK